MKVKVISKMNLVIKVQIQKISILTNTKNQKQKKTILNQKIKKKQKRKLI